MQCQYLSLYSSQLLEDAVMKMCSSWYKLLAGSICHKFQYAEVLSSGYSALYSLWDSQIPVQSIMICPQAPVCIQLICSLAHSIPLCLKLPLLTQTVGWQTVRTDQINSMRHVRSFIVKSIYANKLMNHSLKMEDEATSG